MEKYEVVKHLGAGNFGVARLMRHKDTQELVAMKYIERGHKVLLLRLSISPFNALLPSSPRLIVHDESKF